MLPYQFIGIFLLIFSIIFLQHAKKDGDKEGVTGMTALLGASLILLVIFGLLYSSVY